MKKSFPANINGTVYYIDEDAYLLLDRYLNELRHTFTGETGTEIVADIESRISEHFSLKDSQVIVFEDVEKVISVIGRPEQLGEADADEAAAFDPEEPKAAACNQSSAAQTPPPYPAAAVAADGRRRLFRDPKDAVFGGVFAGLGYYLGWNVTAMRVLYATAAVLTQFWPLMVLYLVAWMLIPAARTPRQILEMMGEPVNITTIGDTLVDGIKDNFSAAATGVGHTFARGFQSIGRIVMAFFGGVAALAAFALAIVALVVVAGIILWTANDNASILNTFSADQFGSLTLGGVTLVLIFTAIIIPLVGLAWGGLMALFNAPAPSRATVISLIVIEVCVIVAAVVFAAVAGETLGSYASLVETACMTPACVSLTIA